MDLTKAIKSRRSVKKYGHLRPDWRKILRSIDMARHAPMAGNIFSLKFLIVNDEEIIQEIGKTTAQTFVGTAKTLVVLVNDESRVVRNYGERGKRYASQQAGAAIQNFLLALEEEKLGTTWVGYFNEEKIKELLGIPEGLIVEAIFPIGLKTKIKPKEKQIIDLENIIYFEKWGREMMTDPKRVKSDGI